MEADRPIPLAAFAEVQNDNGDVSIVQGADGAPHVIASGRTREGTKVEWLRTGATDEAQQQVVQRFLAAISDEYGARITHNVAAELGLESVSGSLHTRSVREALRMAESQRDVFSGANFFVELHCSAEARSPAFAKACSLVGLEASALAPSDLHAIDERFGAAVAKASQGNRAPLSTSDGERILLDVLNAWLARSPRAHD